MDSHVYRIKKAFVIPLAIDTVLLLSLLIVSIMTDRVSIEIALFAFFTVFAAYLFMESLFRKVDIDGKVIRIKKLFGLKVLPWEGITHVGGLVIKNKAFILLTTTSGLFIISNSYESFTALFEDIATHVDPSRVEAEVPSIIAHSPSGKTNTALPWVAALLLGVITILKINQFF